MVAFKHSICVYSIILRNLNFVQCISPMEKAWFMAPMEYSPFGRDIMAPMDYTPMVNSPNGKGMVLWKIVF